MLDKIWNFGIWFIENSQYFSYITWFSKNVFLMLSVSFKIEHNEGYYNLKDMLCFYFMLNKTFLPILCLSFWNRLTFINNFADEQINLNFEVTSLQKRKKNPSYLCMISFRKYPLRLHSYHKNDFRPKQCTLVSTPYCETFSRVMFQNLIYIV